MEYHYAQLNEEHITIGEHWLSGEVHQDDYVLIDMDFSPWNKKYEDGEWIELPPPPEPDPNLISEEEQAQLEMQENIEYLVDLAEMNMEV